MSKRKAESAPEEEYVVEKIVDKRTTQGKVEYMLKWKGWEDADNTWEPVEHIGKDIVAKYEKSIKMDGEKLVPGKITPLDKTTLGKKSRTSEIPRPSKTKTPMSTPKKTTKDNKNDTSETVTPGKAKTPERIMPSRKTNTTETVVPAKAKTADEKATMDEEKLASVKRTPRDKMSPVKKGRTSETSRPSKAKALSEKTTPDKKGATLETPATPTPERKVLRRSNATETAAPGKTKAAEQKATPVKKGTRKSFAPDTETNDYPNKSTKKETSKGKMKDAPTNDQLSGFEQGFVAENIVGATEQNNQLLFLLKWEGKIEASLVSSKEANEKCPQVVIKFYESRLAWRTEDESDG